MSEAKAEDRARVMALLVEPMRLAGVRRLPKHTVADHENAMARLCQRLGYLSDKSLESLAESLIDGATSGCWPSEMLVMSYARRLEKPPVEESKIVSSWFSSIEGPKAEAGGYLVELYRFLLQAKRPPLFADDRKIYADARDNARMVERVRDRIARGAESAEDLEWLQRYLADQQAARAIVEQGAQKRADKEGQAV
jgi:hypothetical protein